MKEIEEILKEEMERLRDLNKDLQKKGIEISQIKDNALTMCEIAKTLKELRYR